MKPIHPTPDQLGILLYSDLQLIEDTKNQLQKDLQKMGWDGQISYEPENALESLTELLAKILASYLEKDSQRFFRFMYILDLDEKKVLTILKQENPFHSIAHMAIMRECMKVILRKNMG
ncbi:MAG: hypothetical protein K1X82_00625 [Bacteroidia bacterium]|nr:hypothetical protein [Bacteroidia bacterium]